MAAALAVGLTPTVSTAPALTAATVDYLRGTNIGWTPTDQQYRDFVSRVLDGTGTPADPPAPSGFVDYNAGFWPVSNNGIFDLTWNASVAQGVAHLEAKDPESDVVFGLSQGAVVVSRYKAAHPEGTGNTFVVVENPSRPNGGVLERFAGLYIPILNITFTGATPDNGDLTIDVARQYDGWADFPTYPLNLLATANAIMGMIYVHGQTQTELTAIDIEAAKAGGNAYYQVHGDTTYYLVRTPLVPLLIPLKGYVPDPVLNAIDPVLRKFIEMGYDRTDYSAPTRAKLFPPISLPSLPSPTAAQNTVTPAEATSTVTPTAKAVRSAASAPKASTPRASTPRATAAKAGAPKKAAGTGTGNHQKGTGGSARPSKASSD
ncbi:PE-PPE domain-containing protein [Mycobacterium sp. CVI_P3]|uniref:PE-PPE domain-containing protein n=1 Tax=Mycobacterium pinniadriaticum TaxID=2994102 RepID=UPI002248DB7F|nr:PE-PPE domain-containing protein [Mycobacterium pinniadriaticum]MCX2931039.1 PE-PPE domain-containing protein [Mycobacterium pinniadriaticum]